MDIIGRWKVAKALYIDPETGANSWETPEALILDGRADEEYAMMMTSVFDFCEDGYVRAAMQIPEMISKEEIDEAVKAGEITLYDGNMMLLEEKAWKEENGKYYYDSGVDGTVGDEKVSPWIELTEEDGMIELMTFKLIRAE